MGLAASLTLDDIVARLRALDDQDDRRGLLAVALAEHDAETLLLHLRSEFARHRQIDTREALRLADALIAGAQLAGRADHWALGVMARGDALYLLGQYTESVSAYEAAQQSFLAQGDEIGWARTHIGWVVACHYLGRGAMALAALPPAYDILVRHQERLRAAAMDMNAGYVCWRLGRYVEALQRYDQARQTFEALGPDQELKVAWTKGNQAIIVALLGDFAAALALHQEARTVLARAGETASLLRTDQYIAEIYAAQGDYTRALRLYGETMAALEAAGLDVDAAWVSLSMGDCYIGLNRPDEALVLARDAVERFERCGTPTEAAKAHYACAVAWLRLGNSDQARQLLNAVGDTFERSEQPILRAAVLLQQASLSLMEENWPSALDAAVRAEAVFASHGLVVRQAQASLLRCRTLVALAELDQAEAGVRTALAMIAQHGLAWLAHEAHYLLASVVSQRGEPEHALAEYDAALASIDRVQARLAIELRGAFLDDKLRVYHDAIDCAVALDRPALAFDYLERAKSRVLVDYLASNPTVRIRSADRVDQALADEVIQLRAEHDWLYRRLQGDGLTRRPDGDIGDDSAAGAESLASAIEERERRIARLVERLALRQAPEFEGLLGLPAVGRPSLPEVDSDTVLVEYYLRDDGAVAFVLTVDGLAPVTLGTTASAVRRLVHLWQLNLDATSRALAADESLTVLARNARGVLAALHRALLAPIDAWLNGRHRVVVIPYGPAHAVPFHALFDGRRYLLEHHEVVVCPSSGLHWLLAQRPRRREGGLLVLACTDSGRLPSVLEEADVVAALNPGATVYREAAATRSVLIEEASRHGSIHLAAHGEARLDNPTFAHLRLGDGQLTTADVFNLDLRGALVVLSACETGRSVVAGGDELIGLSRGFLFAGVAALVQSLWRVEDRSTARLMADFYTELRSGTAPAAALRRAQLALLAADGEREHPFFWAPFQFVGNGRMA